MVMDNKGEPLPVSMSSEMEALFNLSTNLPISHQFVPLERAVAIGMIILPVMLATDIGNLIVLVAIAKVDQLQSSSNRLVASLAVTDMLVGLVVLPLAYLDSIMECWLLGDLVCKLFITIDVSLCTNSILHLLLIAIDRYWTATDATYSQRHAKHDRSCRVGVPLIWFWSLAVGLTSFIRWPNDIQEEGLCSISLNKGYTIYSTLCAFYGPLIAIIVIYINVFSAVKATVRKKNFKQACKTKELRHLLIDQEISTSAPATPTKLSTSTEMSESINLNKGTSPPLPEARNINEDLQVELINGKTVSKISVSMRQTASPKVQKKASPPQLTRQQKLAAKRERKAMRTLLIITGIFVTFWLPFFVLAVIVPFCGERCKTKSVAQVRQVVTWLGYSNSMLNPLIYTIFRPDFRSAFKKILKGCCRC
ncbi:5-hydroxytryptamine receptor 1A-alpha-like [Watersipora subatra]|uniref:5-hydroxytryptamine receptor 1A-alpha-like n=1 Tax=Watersipora subatra TaxID=2589382 RepID=UPI00355B5BEE